MCQPEAFRLKTTRFASESGSFYRPEVNIYLASSHRVKNWLEAGMGTLSIEPSV